MGAEEVETAATQVVRTLRDAGFTAYFAGGWVRDHLLAIPPGDIDIATDAPPTAVMRLFSKTIPVGMAFGSVVVVENGHNFEVTTFRSESGYTDGRHPDQVLFSSAEEDAKRRSFTINGMFYDPLTASILDFVGGKADLAKRLVRAIGNPQERFEEDKLRMLRGVRFAVSLDFELEEKTRQAILACAHKLFPAVAMERVWQEFLKIETPPQFARYLHQLHELGLLTQIFPQLPAGQLPNCTIADLPRETPKVLQIMQLFQTSDLETRLQLCERLKLSRAERQLVELQQQLQEALQKPDLTPTQWAHLYAQPSSELLLEVAACTLPPGGREAFRRLHRQRFDQLAQHIWRIREGRPLVSASALRELGVQPGPEMGLLLREAERLAIDCDLHQASEVIRLLRETPLLRDALNAHEK
jgi:poly(A) polymerase